MKRNKNKLCNFTQISPLHLIVNVFLVRFQTNTLQTRGTNNVGPTLFQRREIETTLNFNPLCLQVIYLNANTSLFMNTVTLCKRDSLTIHLKIRK